jgi:D-3-phosphoglycerate dehydrogenase / 2-oxoglutarate reductase
MMLANLARCSRGRTTAAWTTSSSVYQQVMFTRGFADVDIEVEHVRGQWKTYGNLESYKPGKHHILTFNKISPVGLQRFPPEHYAIFAGDGESGVKSNAHAILLRSHKLKEEDVPHTVRAIAR